MSENLKSCAGIHRHLQIFCGDFAKECRHFFSESVAVTLKISITGLFKLLRACETLSIAIEIVSVAYSTERERKTDHVFHMLLRKKIVTNISYLKKVFTYILLILFHSHLFLSTNSERKGKSSILGNQNS